MAAARHQRGGMRLVDVLRGADNERIIQGALGKIKAQEADGGCDMLLSLLLGHHGDCTAPAREASLAVLAAAASEHVVAAILELARGNGTADGLDLYGATRRLPIISLLRHCQCYKAEQAEAMDDADLATVGDLIRYIEDGADDAHDEAANEVHCRALMLETGGAFSLTAMMTLVREARALVAATARLPAGAGVTNSGTFAYDDGPSCAGISGIDPVQAWSDSGNSAGNDDLRDLDFDGGPGPRGTDNSIEVEGPLPGTRSVGC